MNIKKWIGMVLILIGAILGFISQYMPWHIYHNIYSLGGFDYQVIVYYQTSLIAMLFLPVTYLPLIGAFIGLCGCMLCLLPFTLRIGKWLGVISGIILLLAYLLFPLLYYMLGMMLAMFGSFVDSFFPNLIGGWLCISSAAVFLIGGLVIPKSEIVEKVEKEGKKEGKKVSKKAEKGVKMVKCIACGATIKETDQFCPECGAFQ